MNETELNDWLTTAFQNVATQQAHGYTFYFVGAEKNLPFVTIAHTGNPHEAVSALHRPGVYRLNIGVGPATYRALFGTPPAKAGATGVVETGHDFTAIDVLLPHPHYPPQGWVCILSPSTTMTAQVQTLVAEAYGIAATREAKRAGPPA